MTNPKPHWITQGALVFKQHRSRGRKAPHRSSCLSLIPRLKSQGQEDCSKSRPACSTRVSGQPKTPLYIPYIFRSFPGLEFATTNYFWRAAPSPKGWHKSKVREWLVLCCPKWKQAHVNEHQQPDLRSAIVQQGAQHNSAVKGNRLTHSPANHRTGSAHIIKYHPLSSSALCTAVYGAQLSVVLILLRKESCLKSKGTCLKHKNLPCRLLTTRCSMSLPAVISKMEVRFLSLPPYGQVTGIW